MRAKGRPGSYKLGERRRRETGKFSGSAGMHLRRSGGVGQEGASDGDQIELPAFQAAYQAVGARGLQSLPAESAQEVARQAGRAP